MLITQEKAETQAKLDAMRMSMLPGLGRQAAWQENGDMRVQAISIQPQSWQAGLYLRRVVSSSGCCSTSHSALTCQSTNQGIHHAFCCKSYLQHRGGRISQKQHFTQ